MSEQAKYKNYILNKVIFSFLISFVLVFEFGFLQVEAKTKSKSKSKHRLHTVKKHRPTKEEEEAAREKAERDAAEARLVEGKNIILARAYRLYDSGTSECLQGNYKYSILQLKLADELLKEHGQTNSSLAISTLTELASSAQAAKDYPLAKSTYERLQAMRPQDTNILVDMAKLEAAQSNFNGAQNYINKLFEIDPNNPQGRLIADFIASKLKPVKH